MIETKEERNLLIESNLGLVHSCANRFKGRGAEYDDLFQAGCLGLIKAADNYDPDKGFMFSTYAVPVILGEIKRIFRDGGSIKIGRAIKEKSRNAVRFKEELSKKLGREPTVNELSDFLDISPAETAMLINASMPVLSLEPTEDNENGIDIPVCSPEDEVSDFIALKQVLLELDDKDRRIIELRYYKGLTQTVTANILGMTQVQVSRKEKNILLNLRKKLSY